MLVFLTVLIMLIVAYAHMREGFFTAALMFFNVFLAGLLTFNFWEPIADMLDPLFQGGLLAGYEDILVLSALFCIFLGILRAITNRLAPLQTSFHALLHQFGGAGFGLLTGYLVAGFLVCAWQTLPWHESFMNYQPRASNEPNLRRFVPPDRVWLSLMRYGGAHSFAWKEEKEDDDPYDRYFTFDRHGTFEMRFLRYRRHGDKREPLKYQGEFDVELYKAK